VCVRAQVQNRKRGAARRLEFSDHVADEAGGDEGCAHHQGEDGKEDEKIFAKTGLEEAGDEAVERGDDDEDGEADGRQAPRGCGDGVGGDGGGGDDGNRRRGGGSLRFDRTRPGVNRIGHRVGHRDPVGHSEGGLLGAGRHLTHYIDTLACGAQR